MVKFIHQRSWNAEIGGEMLTRGGRTIAYTCQNNVIKFAAANCSPRDNFCRKTGRVIAEGRLNSAKYTREIVKQEDQTEYEAITEAL